MAPDHKALEVSKDDINQLISIRSRLRRAGYCYAIEKIASNPDLRAVFKGKLSELPSRLANNKIQPHINHYVTTIDGGRDLNIFDNLDHLTEIQRYWNHFGPEDKNVLLLKNAIQAANQAVARHKEGVRRAAEQAEAQKKRWALEKEEKKLKEEAKRKQEAKEKMEREALAQERSEILALKEEWKDRLYAMVHKNGSCCKRVKQLANMVSFLDIFPKSIKEGRAWVDDAATFIQHSWNSLELKVNNGATEDRTRDGTEVEEDITAVFAEVTLGEVFDQVLLSHLFHENPPCELCLNSKKVESLKGIITAAALKNSTSALLGARPLDSRELEDLGKLRRLLYDGVIAQLKSCEQYPNFYMRNGISMGIHRRGPRSLREDFNRYFDDSLDWKQEYDAFSEEKRCDRINQQGDLHVLDWIREVASHILRILLTFLEENGTKCLNWDVTLSVNPNECWFKEMPLETLLKDFYNYLATVLHPQKDSAEELWMQTIGKKLALLDQFDAETLVNKEIKQEEGLVLLGEETVLKRSCEDLSGNGHLEKKIKIEAE
ncbi:hypothetical protein BJ508DRAFT_331050 [Ascobolus immersus RN42]|uniref:Uncharacterized protein n=1 Tax=Ascobolus immersus RN42 TaxID=1160509 RepID=A0A3N4HX06_ASCIM|nr:hypothetical protein BJ508DRAFT_331050 [Ascobolus immersus RN42]